MTSVQNKQVKQWKKLKTVKGRKQEGLYLVEGPHLLDEALKTGQTIHSIMTSDPEEVFGHFAAKYPEDRLSAYTWIHISEGIRSELATTVTNQNVFAVIEAPKRKGIEINATSRFLILDGIQDPGNMGTLLRSAVAFGFHQVFVSKDCVDLYNDKVLRSGQGAHYYVETYTGDLGDLYEQFKAKEVRIYTTALTQTSQLSHQVEYTSPMALVLGNEGRGVSSVSQEASEVNVLIPMVTTLESLNVGVAGSILMYQAMIESMGERR